MQKNYRDYTVGELLDSGFEVEVSNFDVVSKKQAFKALGKFEGVKQSSDFINGSYGGFEMVKGWKEGFKIKFYNIKEK